MVPIKKKFTENRSNMILTGLRYKYPLAVYKLAVSGVYTWNSPFCIRRNIAILKLWKALTGWGGGSLHGLIEFAFTILCPKFTNPALFLL